MLSEEELLLTRDEAAALLRAQGRTVQRIERVCVDDAILFIGAYGRPWTAWLERDGSQVAVRYEEGWSATLGSCARVSDPYPSDSNPDQQFSD